MHAVAYTAGVTAHKSLWACSSSRCPVATTCRTLSRRLPSPASSALISTQTASALRVFEGAERRFERHGESGGVLVVDDYAHHPTEIAAVLAAARAASDVGSWSRFSRIGTAGRTD